jgi:hypothetical protein
MRIYSRPIGNGSFRRLCKLYGEKRRGNGVTPLKIRPLWNIIVELLLRGSPPNEL